MSSNQQTACKKLSLDNYSTEEDSMEDFEDKEASEYIPIDSEEEEDEDLDSILNEIEEDIEPLVDVPIVEDKYKEISGLCENPIEDKKFIVFQSCLEILISMIPCQYRHLCLKKLTHVQIRQYGTAINVYVKCEDGHSQKLWSSQPKINKIPAGNLILSSGIVLSGNNFVKIKNLFHIINMFMISESTHYHNQPKFVLPMIHEKWKQEQRELILSIGSSAICLAGDGQSDSPGFSAKYCIYTMMESEGQKFLDFTVEQIIPPATSVSLEKTAFKKTLDNILQSNVNVRIITTDRHVGIRKILKEEYSNINHQFDVWHLAKSVGQKILLASKGRNCSTLSPWRAPVKNHLWWSARNCQENPDDLLKRWLSVLFHVQNVHEWETDGGYSHCHHLPDVKDTKWLEENSMAFEN
ncbi:uncharacterized protein LOC142664084 [Rhinoderma darwinii]|uniref:uncharacterized protein LOC142664084 n=1 Tax=Rhinoderma darwinii TaxID=43563 RepID=UPI003F665C1A